MAIGKVLKNSGIYTVVSILQKCISFFLLPLYTAYLTPSDYGVLNIVTSVSSLLSILFLLGLTGAVSRLYFNHPDDNDYVKHLWGAITVCVLISSLVIGGIFIIFHQFLVDPLVGDIQFYPYMFLGVCYTIVTPLYLLYQTCLQTKQNSVHYGINMLANFVINTLLIIFFVAVLKRGVLGVLEANLITAVLFFLYVCVDYLPKLFLNLKKEYVVPAYKYSLPLVPHLLAGWSTGLLDRLLINGMKGESETGLFSVAKQFSSILTTLTNSVNMAYTPWLFESNEKKQFNEIRTVGTLAVILYCAIALLISLFSPEVLSFMVSDQFKGVWTIIPVLTFAMVFNGMYFLFVDVLFIEKTKLVFIISVSSMALNVILNFILIPRYGIEGSAWACFISYLIKSLIALWLYKSSNEDIQYNWVLMYIITLVLFALSFINFPLSRMGLMSSLCIKSGLIVLFCIIFYCVYKDGVKYVLGKGLSMIIK